MLIGEDHHGVRLATPEHSEAHIPAQTFSALALTEGETLVLTPRKARVFVS